MLDYIIVGGGLAGLAFARQAQVNRKSFVIMEGGFPSASEVAGGIYNPVVLKRLRMVDDAPLLLDRMHRFFDQVLEDYGIDFRNPLPIWRKIASIEEQNDWFAACDRMPQFLEPSIVANSISGVDAAFGFGRVLGTGYVETSRFISHLRNSFTNDGFLLTEQFDFNQLRIADGISYKNLFARHIVFAEGCMIRNNPYFEYLPLVGTKGELLHLKISDLKLDVMIKGGVFVMPLANQVFKVGSTYNWSDTTWQPTMSGREEILSKFEEIIDLPYEIVGHIAGIRPTVKDRKPLIGTHPEYKNVHVLNGLGSRGVMLAPAMSEYLFDHIENETPLPSKYDIARFTSLRRDRNGQTY